MIKVPFPKKTPKLLKIHGDERVDNYYWLRDDSRKNKEVLNYLKKENKYSEEWFKKCKNDHKKIFQYYKDSIPNFEEGFKINFDGYKYYSTASLSSEHRKYYRDFKNKKKLILDVNKEARNKSFYEISPT